MEQTNLLDRLIDSSLLTAFYQQSRSAEDRYLRLVFSLFLLPGILLLLLFCLQNFITGAVLESGLDFGAALFLAGIIYSLKFVQRATNLCRISLLALALLFYYISLVGGTSGYKVLWINLFPIGAFFMLGNREGAVWSLVFMLGMVFLLSDLNTVLPVFHYTDEFRLRIHMVYLTIVTLMFMYETARRFYQQGLYQKQRLLIEERQKLAQAEEQYRLLVENAHDGIFIVQDELIRFANPTARKYLGLDDESPLGLPLSDFIHPDDRNQVMNRHRQRIAGENPTNHYLFRVVSRHNQIHYLELNAVRIDWNGRPAVICFCHDITQTKNLERQLLQAQKMQAIGTLAGGIAHDFNNMLQAIIGYTEISMRLASTDAELCKRLNRILQAGNRARDLIGQILTFSRQQKEEQRPVAIGAIIKEVLKLLKASTPATIEFIPTIEDDAGIVMADPTRIHQLVMNLCTNAAHAMKQSGGKLAISLKPFVVEASLARRDIDLLPGSYVQLKVSDTGCGMDPQTLARIFEPYFSTKKRGEGTGLGLAVVHGIVKNLNGSIVVYSEPNEGTTFNVFIPRVDSETDEIGRPAEPSPRGSETILLVDDEAIVMEIGREILEGLGYRVVARVSSIEAYHAFCASPEKFDALVTDYTMPQMTGVELAGKIKRLRKNLPTIMCTGFSAELTASTLQDAGVDIMLNKPVLTHELATALRKLLDNASSHSNHPAPGALPSAGETIIGR